MIIGRKKQRSQIIQAIIFDMGGVLLRTKSYKNREIIARDFNVSLSDLENLIFESRSSICAEEGKKTYDEHWGSIASSLNISIDAVFQVAEEFFKDDEFNTQLLDFIKQLHMRGIYTGLLSNAWEGARHRVSIRCPGFLDHFDEVVFSYEAGCRKPDSRIFLHILEKISVKPENSLFIDDVKKNVDGAKAIGMHAILFLDNEQVIAVINSML